MSKEDNSLIRQSRLIKRTEFVPRMERLADQIFIMAYGKIAFRIHEPTSFRSDYNIKRPPGTYGVYCAIVFCTDPYTGMFLYKSDAKPPLLSP